MAGHSQFKNIMYRKGAQDAKKAKMFAKLARDITIAAKSGLPEPDKNPRLRLAIQAARAESMPKDNIERAIAKATQAAGGADYVAARYEGFGPGKVAVIVEAMTDNKNRTAADVRHAFDKFGGNLGTSGCVSFMFSDQGTVIVENNGADEDKIMEDCFEAGADDFSIEDDEAIEIVCEPNKVTAVSEALTGMGYKVVSAEAEKVPSNYTKLEDEEAIKKMNLLLEMLEDNDDVQNVYHNWEMPEE